MTSERSSLLSSTDDAAAKLDKRKKQARVWAAIFGTSIVATHVIYLILGLTVLLLIELACILLTIVYLVSIKRPRPTPRQLNGVCIIVIALGLIELGRLIAFHILEEFFLEERQLWKLIVYGACGSMIFICVVGLVVSLRQYRRVIVKEMPGHSQDSSV